MMKKSATRKYMPVEEISQYFEERSSCVVRSMLKNGMGICSNYYRYCMNIVIPVYGKSFFGFAYKSCLVKLLILTKSV